MGGQNWQLWFPEVCSKKCDGIFYNYICKYPGILEPWQYMFFYYTVTDTNTSDNGKQHNA